MFHFNHREKLDVSRARFVYGISFFMGLSGALVMYTASTYFSQAWKTDNIGLVYVVLHTFNLLALLFFHRLVVSFGKSATLLTLLVLQIFLATGLSLGGVSPLASLLLMAFLAFMVLLWVSLDSILESFSIDSHSGRIRGTYLASMNAGLLMGPLLSTTLIESYGYEGLYFIVALFFIILFFLAFVAFRSVNHLIKKRISVRKLLKEIKKRPDILFIYWVSWTLDFFYAILVVYTPLYFRSLGMSWSDIGIILSLALIPFVLIQYPVGRLADKRLGEKEMIIVALAIIALSVSFMPQIESNSVLVWGILLVVGRIGAAFLEILRDSYFYKRIDGENVGMINFFRTSRPIAYILASGSSALLLLFLPLSSVFWLVVGVAVIGLYPALRLQDNGVSQD